MDGFLREIENQTALAASELLDIAELLPGQILVLGLSTSEVLGKKIGSSGSKNVAEAIISVLYTICTARGIHLAVQCCEHLNRALVVENFIVRDYRLDEVAVVPMPHAGGAAATYAMQMFEAPKVVEHIQAHAGLDIGNTFIGMHLKHVAVPVRLAQKKVGQALVTAARTRPKFIGGQRAVYILSQGGTV